MIGSILEVESSTNSRAGKRTKSRSRDFESSYGKADKRTRSRDSFDQSYMSNISSPEKQSSPGLFLEGGKDRRNSQMSMYSRMTAQSRNAHRRNLTFMSSNMG